MSNVGVLASKNMTIRHTWEIDDFQNNVQNSTCLMSPVFSTILSGQVKKWRMRFYPQSTVTEFSKYTSIFLDYLSDGEVELFFKCETCDPYYQNYSKESPKIKLTPQCATYSFNNFIERNSYFFGRSKLTISCHITTVEPLKIDSHSASDNRDENYRLGSDLDKLFDAGTLTDVTIIIGEEKLSLHKAILAGRSEVFRAMFENDMIEKQESVVKIDDIRMEIATEMFRYMYTDRFKNTDEANSKELLIAAEKYSVTGLQILCEKALFLHLNFDNALEYLILASKYKTIDLKMQVTDFMTKHLDKFIDEPQFKSLDQSIMYDMLSSIAKLKKDE